MKKELLSIGESLKERLVDMNRFIHDNPELRLPATSKKQIQSR